MGKANEGGELFMSQGHRCMRRVFPKASAVPSFCAEGSDALDGFLPVVLHMTGFSVIATTFYAHPTVGFAGENLQRFAKLGALLQSVQLPWFIVGDFNIDISVFQRSAFLKRIQGFTRRADIEFTCVGSAGNSHIVVASENCLPYIHSVSSVTDVPWSPHCGLESV